MGLSAALGNQNNWDLLYNETESTPVAADGSYFPIPRFTLPVLAESPLLYCAAENLQAKRWWYLGYRLFQMKQVAISPGEASVKMARVMLNRPSLIYFENFAQDYQLDVEIPPWFNKMKISIWQYSGEINDSTKSFISSQLQPIADAVARIEATLNG